MKMSTHVKKVNINNGNAESEIPLEGSWYTTSEISNSLSGSDTPLLWKIVLRTPGISVVLATCILL